MGLLKNILKVRLLLFIFMTAMVGYAQTSDFKVQHIQDDVANTGGLNTTFTPVSSLNNAVALANNNRKTHAGRTDLDANNLEGDDMSGARQLTGTNTLTYYRESGSIINNMRFNTSIWEYVGATGGCNEMIVRGRYQIDLNGTTNTFSQNISALGIVNNNNCIPFITGIMNNSIKDDADSATAIAYLDSSTATMIVEKGSNANTVTVFITLVEFTGANWTVLHGDSGAVGTDIGTIDLYDGADGSGTATNVNSWSEAIIFGQFRANNTTNGVDDSLSDLWPVLTPGATGKVDWTFHNNHVSATNTNRHFVHILSNPFIFVKRFQDTSNIVGETTIDITSVGLSDINEGLIVGSSTSSGNGTAYGRGWRNYYLKSTTEAVHWAHRRGNTMSHEIQIIDLSGLTAQDINVVDSASNVISNGSTDSPSAINDTEFGNVGVGTSLAKIYTIENNGSCDLTISSIISGNTDFVVSAVPASVAANSSATFTVTYTPLTLGISSAIITISNNSSDNTEQPYTFTVQGTGAYCSSNGADDSYEYIDRVQFKGIDNNNSGAGTPSAGYTDFTGIATNVTLNTNYSITITPFWSGSTWDEAYSVWIDYNQDGDFSDPGEQVWTQAATQLTPVTGSFTIPATAKKGSTIMRVSMSGDDTINPLTIPPSCGSFPYGEVEDYTINITSSVNFNGTTNDYIDFGDNHNLAAGASFSLEAWVLQNNNTGFQTIISKGDGNAANYRGYRLFLNNGNLNLTWADNSGGLALNLESPYAIPINEWHHVAATYNGTTIVLYVDGIQVNSSAFSTYATQTEPFLLGAIYDSSNPTTPAFNLDGYISEVRVWNTALSVAQIREMMSQEIKQNGSIVKGKTTPLDISESLQWLNLIGYYPMNDDTANDQSGNAIHGATKNMNSSQPQTVPLPYVSTTDGVWDSPTIWLNNSEQYIPNSIGIDGITSIDWNIVEINHNITSGTRNIAVSSLISNAGKLTIDGATTTDGTGTGQSLTVTNYLLLNGEIDLEGESQLIQTTGSVLDEDSGGSLERDQQGTSNSYNYNYWSSSVGPITISSGSPIGAPSTNSSYKLNGNLFDGTDTAVLKNISFNTPYTWADSGISNPAKISTYWLYKFYGADSDYYAWAAINENTTLLPGEGYTMKGTSGATVIGVDFQNYTFKGKPYNGDITIPFDNSLEEKNRLIGNPYPSAIDAVEFINDNINDMNGAIYFWDHFGKKDSHNLGDYVGGYAVRNLTAGAKAISNDARINNDGSTGTKIPGQYIPVGQGFFVISEVPITPITSTEIIFKNSQRVFVTEASANSVFMKSNDGKKDSAVKSTTNTTVDTRPKIRLMYDSPTGYHREIVIGLDENTTNNFDIGYDAPIADVNVEDMYWLIQGVEFVIQGVNNFDVDQEFPIGIIVSETGLTRIKIDSLENLDSSNTPLFIKDNLTGESFQINDAPFEITLEPGEYSDRFSLTFKTQDTLAVEDEVLEDGVYVFMNNTASELQINNTIQAEFTSVRLYNSLGQLVNTWNKNLENTRITLPIHNKSTGVYIVQINTVKGVVSKKIVIQ